MKARVFSLYKLQNSVAAAQQGRKQSHGDHGKHMIKPPDGMYETVHKAVVSIPATVNANKRTTRSAPDRLACASIRESRSDREWVCTFLDNVILDAAGSWQSPDKRGVTGEGPGGCA